MVAHGLEPSQFVISKDWATQAAVPLPFLRPFFYDYTVFIGEENFTVTEPNDMRVPGLFLSALHRRRRDHARTAARAARRPDQPRVPLDGAADLIISVSRTRRSVLYAAPQIRDHRECRLSRGPRISSAPLRSALHPGHKSYPPIAYSPHCRASVASAQPSQ